jgi:hypothetical protein
MDVQSQTDLKAYADRLEVLCRAQADEISRLRGELARATEGAGALATLQSLYRDPAMPEALRAKCAIGCLPHEEPRLLPQRQLELKAEEPVRPLSEVVAERRARQDALEGRPIEIVPDPRAPYGQRVNLLSKPNGSGDDDSSD